MGMRDRGSDGTRWEKVGTRFGLPERPTISLFQDDREALWVGTSAGVYRKLSHETVFTPFPAFSDAIESVIQDAAGNIVVTHPTHLISELRGSDQSADPLGLERSHGTRLLLDREGSVWVGTRSQGLVRVRDDRARGRVIDRMTRADGLSADSVLALTQDREGNIWVGTPFGLNRLSENAIIPVPTDIM